MTTKEISRWLRSQRQPLAEEIVARQYNLRAEQCQLLGEEGRRKSVRDVGYHLIYLAEALAAEDVALFNAYLAWVKVLFAGLGFSDAVILTTLACTREVLNEHLSEGEKDIVLVYLDAGMEALNRAPSQVGSHIEPDSPLHELAESYLNALLRGDRHQAGEIVMDAVEAGTPIKQIYLDVFQPVQREIGRLWQTNRISVAQEHYCTAATQLIMSQLYPRIFSGERIGHSMVATCVGGELHEIGVRMVADFFEMEGWDTYYLGANTPTESVLSTVEQRNPDILAISTTITMHVSQVAALIEQVRAKGAGSDVNILVGGYPFNTSSQLWRQVGADGYAADAQDALQVAENIL
jgi:methanogenic corrinoid protein MtbC1